MEKLVELKKWEKEGIVIAVFDGSVEKDNQRFSSSCSVTGGDCLVHVEFGQSLKDVVGEIKNHRIEDEKLKVDMLLYRKEQHMEALLELKPVVGGVILQQQKQADGTLLITKFKLMSVGLTRNPVDPRIPSLKDQMK